MPLACALGGWGVICVRWGSRLMCCRSAASLSMSLVTSSSFAGTALEVSKLGGETGRVRHERTGTRQLGGGRRGAGRRGRHGAGLVLRKTLIRVRSSSSVRGSVLQVRERWRKREREGPGKRRDAADVQSREAGVRWWCGVVRSGREGWKRGSVGGWITTRPSARGNRTIRSVVSRTKSWGREPRRAEASPATGLASSWEAAGRAEAGFGVQRQRPEIGTAPIRILESCKCGTVSQSTSPVVQSSLLPSRRVPRSRLIPHARWARILPQLAETMPCTPLRCQKALPSPPSPSLAQPYADAAPLLRATRRVRWIIDDGMVRRCRRNAAKKKKT